MRPGLRKLVLTVHLVASLGWVGAAAAYLALGVAVTTGDEETARAAWVAMDVIARAALVPLAVAALATGVVLGLGTPWGLFRHYWVAISLVATMFATAILLLHMPTVSAVAEAARRGETGGHGGDLLHAGGGLAVLLAIAALNVYKPRGLTPYGWRKQVEESRK